MKKHKNIRIAVMTDIHGNLVALNHALTAIEEQICDEIYVLGDSIAIGPYPKETLDLLLGVTEIKMVLGNHEIYYVKGLDPHPDYMQEGEVSHQKWVSEQLGEPYKKSIASLPLSITKSFYGVTVTFQHYGITDSSDEFHRFASPIRDPNGDELDKMFSDVNSDLIFYGHMHSPSQVSGKSRYVNPGSLGCSKDSNARVCIADFYANGAYTINTILVPYDKELVFKEMHNRKMPERDFICKAFFGEKVTTYNK